MEGKKYLIVLVLRLLETETDCEHPVTQVEIANVISRLCPCDRKTVGRNIKLLQEVGYPIVKTAKGFYMDRQLFTRREVELVVGAVRAGMQDAAVDTEDLCDRLRASLSRYYRSV